MHPSLHVTCECMCTCLCIQDAAVQTESWAQKLSSPFFGVIEPRLHPGSGDPCVSSKCTSVAHPPDCQRPPAMPIQGAPVFFFDHRGSFIGPFQSIPLSVQKKREYSNLKGIWNHEKNGFYTERLLENLDSVIRISPVDWARSRFRSLAESASSRGSGFRSRLCACICQTHNQSAGSSEQAWFTRGIF